MPSLNGTSTGKEYWRSLDDFADSPEFRTFIENEFPSQLENVITPSTRRSFLKLMGASLAFAGVGLQGCRRWPDEKIAPFAHRPNNYVPGEPEYFASTFDLGGVAHGVVVKSFDGRPIKVEGNEMDPINAGSSNTFVQASILDMYDPERLRQPLERDAEQMHPRTMAEFKTAATAKFAEMRSRRGQRVAIIANASASATFRDMKERARTALPEARWYDWESVSRDNEIIGSQLAFGVPARRTQYDVAQCDALVCLDSDFLVAHPAAAKHARQWAQRRGAVDSSMPRHYAVEGALSLTGANADHRMRAKSRDIAAVAALLAKRLGERGVNVLGANDVSLPMSDTSDWDAFINPLADDLAATSMRGRSIIVAGPRQPAEVHAMVHAINFALGNVGNTINYTQEPEGDRQPHVDAIRAFTQSAANGEFDTLIIIGGNPVFDAPADLRFGDAITGIGTRIHLTLVENETSQFCHWSVPLAHWLESWGDGRAWDGTLTVRQPLILPLYEGVSEIELLAMLAGDSVQAGYDLVRRWFRERRGEFGFEQAWRTFLRDGVLADSAWPFEDVQLDASRWTNALANLLNQAANVSEPHEVVFAEDYSVYDGRFANNGWLQEMPDPIAKIAWDNAAFMSPATADALDVSWNDKVYIDLGPGAGDGQANRLAIAVHVVPGMADDVIAVNLGYGRTAGGHIAHNVGFDVNRVRTTNAMHFAPAVVDKAAGEGSYVLATVQDHHAMDRTINEWGKQRRLPNLVREASLEDYESHGRDAFFGHKHHMPIISLWDEHRYEPQYLESGEINPNWSPNKWGMLIDLNACNGCSACMIACQAENNVPIVGKDQVIRGREMHWIRVDRYFKGGNINEPGVVFQPVPCQHCENAPCEQVCPVAATTHDRDGINVMVYNRCVGTRYCSNNCPYKVRRFNFYDWHYSDPKDEGIKPPAFVIPDEQDDVAFSGENKVKSMAFNPDVTVRSRGVMEKCSFCIQRINKAKIKVKNAFVRENGGEQSSDARSYHIPDGMFTTACAQACPSQAIIFGDLHDPESRVSKAFKSDRRYSLLEEINTKPRTQYLARVNNYHHDIAAPVPFASDEHGGGDNGTDHGGDDH